MICRQPIYHELPRVGATRGANNDNGAVSAAGSDGGTPIGNPDKESGGQVEGGAGRAFGGETGNPNVEIRKTILQNAHTNRREEHEEGGEAVKCCHVETWSQFFTLSGGRQYLPVEGIMRDGEMMTPSSTRHHEVRSRW
jgi:hypothetical protein